MTARGEHDAYLMAARAVSTLTVEQVVEAITRADLVSESALEAVFTELGTRLATVGSNDLIQGLLESGLLTPFQADMTRMGRAGELVISQYVLLSRIGEGAMGTVYKAMHRRMKRVVALKTLRQQVGGDKSQFLQRFFREIEAAARLNHPNAVAAYDAGEYELGHFLVMEFVDGLDLRRHVEQTGPMTVQDAVSSILQVAEALEYAHVRGIVHRDIKPANLLRDEAGVVKLADLGLVRLNATADVNESASLTQAGTSMGTVDYMSPEQAMDASLVDHRADIYSLGVTLFWCLTGRPMYDGPTLMARLLAHRQNPIPSLREIRSDVPEKLDDLFRRMVAKSPDDRPDSAADVADELRSLEQAVERKTTDWNPAEMTVVLVEPSRLQVAVVKQYLGELGIDDVHICRNAAETLAMLTQLRPRIVVTSYQLTDGSGVEFAQRVRDDMRWSLVPIVLMTGTELPKSVIDLVESATALKLIFKPFPRETLETAMKEALRESHGVDARLSGLERLDVLIVDDSSVARRKMQQVLSEIGFERFTHAADGTEAIDCLMGKSFDLVVTDYNMPKMNGYALVRYIRKESNQIDVPVIMCTTEYDPSRLAEVYQLGVSAICNKSFEPELVRNIIARLFM